MNTFVSSQDDQIKAALTIFLKLDKEVEKCELFFNFIEVTEILLPNIKEEKRISSENKSGFGDLLQKIVIASLDEAELLKKKIENEKISQEVAGMKEYIKLNAAIYDLMSKYCTEKAIFYDSNKSHQLALDWYMLSLESSMILLKGGDATRKESIMKLLDHCEYLKKNKISSQVQNFNDEDEKLEDYELEIIKNTSMICGVKYFPFDFIEDSNIKNYFPSFIDPINKIKEKFSDKEIENFSLSKSMIDFNKIDFNSASIKMIRASSLNEMVSSDSNTFTVVKSISPYTIQQGMVSDCSFISSLVTCSNYERKFGTKLVSGSIFPQKDGKPIFNPNGKYAVRLFFNGVWRRVIVDDFFPHIIPKNNPRLADIEPACSHTTNKGELWVSILEKAYLKVCGSTYEFDGSNSGVDMNVLCNFIPETHSSKNLKTKNEKLSMFQRMLTATKYGQSLLTASTGSETNHDYETLGLSGGHAYAILDVKEIPKSDLEEDFFDDINETSLKLILMKNPWNKKRWKGRFSPNDKKRWTKKLIKILHYDIIGEKNYDSGVFWIDFESFLNNFESIHFSWNRNLFKIAKKKHMNFFSFKNGEKIIPFSKNDTFVIQNNPQLNLQLMPGTSCWILLSKHITDFKNSEKDDERDDFLSLLIFEDKINNVGNGFKSIDSQNRLSTKDDKSKIRSIVNNVVYSNSQFRRYAINNESQVIQNYTIVVSNLGNMDTMSDFSFSVTAYSTNKCSLSIIPNFFLTKNVKGKWSIEDGTACGSVNNSTTFRNNPHYIFELSKQPINGFISLECDNKDACLNLMLFNCGGGRIDRPTQDVLVKSSGSYVNGYVELSISDLQINKKYSLVVSTFEKINANFSLSFFNISPNCISIAKLKD